MTDDLLDRRLHDLARAADVPLVAPADDLARGRARVRRQRVTVGVAALASAAAVGVTAALVSGSGGSPSGTPPVAEQSTAVDPTPTPEPVEPTTPPPPAAVDDRDTDQLLDDWRDVVADHLDPDNRHLDKKVTNVQSGSGLGTKLGWSNPGEQGLGEVQLFVSPDFGSQWYLWCDGSQACRDVAVGDIDAKVLRESGTTYVGVSHGGFVVVVSVDALFGNNSTVPVAGLDFGVDELARLAADDRFTMPTVQQLETAGDVTFG